MLLPSALSCDSSTSPLSKPFYPSTTLFASPPISPPGTSHSHSHSNPNTTISSIYSTCRALQSMLSPTLTQLPSPPIQHMSTPLISSPFKLRLRNRSIKSDDTNLTPRKKITKRAAAPPRGVNKRRRALDDELSRESIESSDDNTENEHGKENLLSHTYQLREEREEQGEAEEGGPRTPKRLRLAPEILPMGLERSDFHALHLQHQLSSQPLFFPSSHQLSSHNPQSHQSHHQQQPPKLQEEKEGEDETPNEEWTTEDDRILVELVLEKLKLSKSEWQDCARSLGKDRGSVGKRWKSLMANGEVGLKGRLRGSGGAMKRRGICGSWR